MQIKYLTKGKHINEKNSILSTLKTVEFFVNFVFGIIGYWLSRKLKLKNSKMLTQESKINKLNPKFNCRVS